MTKYDVPLIPQAGNKTCWYAAAQMIVRYYRERRQQSTQEGAEIDTPEATQVVNAANAGLNPSVVERFARGCNLRMELVCPTAAGLEQMLVAYGPLWYGGLVRGYRGATSGAHAVVIYGIDLRSDGGAEVMINDPWPPGVGTQVFYAFEDLFSNLQQDGRAPFLHI